MQELTKSAILRVSILFLASILGFVAGLATYLGTIQVMAVILYPTPPFVYWSRRACRYSDAAFLPYEKAGKSRGFGFFCAATAVASVLSFISAQFYGVALMAI